MNKTKTSFSMEKDLIDQLTEEAEILGYSRSQYVARVLGLRKVIIFLEGHSRNSMKVLSEGEKVHFVIEGEKKPDRVEWKITSIDYEPALDE